MPGATRTRPFWVVITVVACDWLFRGNSGPQSAKGSPPEPGDSVVLRLCATGVQTTHPAGHSSLSSSITPGERPVADGSGPIQRVSEGGHEPPRPCGH